MPAIRFSHALLGLLALVMLAGCATDGGHAYGGVSVGGASVSHHP